MNYLLLFLFIACFVSMSLGFACSAAICKGILGYYNDELLRPERLFGAFCLMIAGLVGTLIFIY